MSHGVNRATLKKGKSDSRIYFLNSLIKKINSKEISGQTARRWSDLLQNHSLVISAITPIQHQLAETECDAEGE